MSWRLISEALLYGVFWIWLLGLVPAAVVSVLKGRLLFFAAGFLTFGITWFIGAIPLADSRSAWARHFYGEKRMAQAADPIRSPRPDGTTALWLSGSAALVLVVGLFAARPAPIIGVDGEALQYSVGSSNLDFSSEPCHRGDGGIWTCRAYDDDASGTVLYEVKVGDLGCWQAARAEWAGAGAPKPLTGCLTFRDQIRPLGLVL